VTDVNRAFLEKEIAERDLADIWRRCV